jgi:hypothetical protein
MMREKQQNLRGPSADFSAIFAPLAEIDFNAVASSF